MLASSMTAKAMKASSSLLVHCRQLPSEPDFTKHDHYYYYRTLAPFDLSNYDRRGVPFWLIGSRYDPFNQGVLILAQMF